MEKEGLKHFLAYSTAFDFYNTAWDEFQQISGGRGERDRKLSADEMHKEFLEYLKEKFDSLVLALWFVNDDDDDDDDDNGTAPPINECESLPKLSTATPIYKKPKLEPNFSLEFDVFGNFDQKMGDQTAGEQKLQCGSQNKLKLKDEKPILVQQIDSEETPPFSCVACKKLFNVKYCLSINSHQRTKPEEKHYKCSHCPWEFKRSADMRVHLRLHTGERPFECNMCDAKFTTKGFLDEHYRRQHIREKPYMCKTCGNSFTTKSDLNAHNSKRHQPLQRKLEKRNFRCKWCNKTFKSQHWHFSHKIKCKMFSDAPTINQLEFQVGSF